MTLEEYDIDQYIYYIGDTCHNFFLILQGMIGVYRQKN